MGEIAGVRSKERMSDISPCFVFQDPINDSCHGQKVIEENFRVLKDQLMVCLRKAGKEDFLAPQIVARPDLRKAFPQDTFNQWLTHNQQALEQLIQHLFTQFCHSCSCTAGRYPTVASNERMSDITPCTFFHDPSLPLNAQTRIEDNFYKLRSQLLVCLRKAGKEDFLVPAFTTRSDVNSPAPESHFNQWTTVNQSVLETLIQHLFSQLCSACSCALGNNPKNNQVPSNPSESKMPTYT